MLRFYVVFLILMGCRSTKQEGSVAIAPPNLIKEYNQARDEKSCEKFSRLARESDFALREMARLRSEQFCLKKPIDPSDYPAWMNGIAVNAAIASAEARGDKRELARLLLEKSKQNLTPEEKISLVERGLELGTQLSDEELSSQARERLLTISPCRKENFQLGEYLVVADDCRYHRKFEKARSLYKSIISSNVTPKTKIAAFKGFRQSFKNSRDQDSYLRMNDQLIQYLEDQLKKKKSRDPFLYKQYVDAGILGARARWTHGSPADAEKVLSRMEKRLKGRWTLTEIFWLRGRIEEEAGHIDVANAWLEKALAQMRPDSNQKDSRDRILWAIAWNFRRSKNFEEASKRFRELYEKSDNEGTRFRTRFWLAKTLLEMARNGESSKEFAALEQEDPLGYYGLLAHQQLGHPIVPVKNNANELKTDSSSAEILQSTLAEALIDVRELDGLQSYLDEVTKVYKKAKNQNDLLWVKLLRLYAHAGLYIKLYENLNQISVEHRNAILEHYPELLFPKPFENEVATASIEMDIPPELIYSIMRQESAFNPRARSGADAYGLMQILPEIAAHFSRQYSISFDRNEDLYDPAINIRFGAALLRQQLEKYRGQFIPAVASYNANDRAVQGWMKTRYHGDSLEFIEEIPYEETRGYVRLVMRNLVFYRLLSTKEQNIPFPEWVLKLSSLDP